MEIYVIRHGQTDVNINNLINSWNDDDLNKTGIIEAEKIVDKIKSIDYDFIICSPLTRTKHTANIINVKNKKILYDKRIIERNAGKLTKTSLKNIDKNDWWSLKPKYDYQDSESVISVIKRIYGFLNDIKSKYNNSNILIVTHGGVSKVIQSFFDGIPKDGSLQKYKCLNCEIKTYIL